MRIKFTAIALLICNIAFGASQIADIELDSMRYKALPDFYETPSGPRKSPMKKLVANEISGFSFAQWDDVRSSGGRKGYTGMCKITITDSGETTLENFYNLGFNIKGNFNAQNQTITFSPQFAFNESPYGDFWLCYFDTQQMGFSTKKDIVLQINADGTLSSTDGWVLIIPDNTSTWYGSAIAMSGGCVFKKSNAIMRGPLRDITAMTFAQTEYPVYLEQTANNQLIIANIADNGHEVVATMTPDKKLNIEPQALIYSSLVGPSCNFPAQWSSTKNQSKGVNTNMTAESDGRIISFGPWGVFRANALIQCSFGMESSDLVPNTGVSLSWPTAPIINFKGDGTKNNPYQIASTDDLDLMSRTVENGENYNGKYFIQTADIDFANYKGLFRPIGIDDKTPFNGVYNGNNKKIKNLKLERGVTQYTGLFGYSGDNSLLENVNIVNGNITTYGKYSGLLVGLTSGKIENCHVTGILSSNAEYLGGIGGRVRGIKNSSFLGQITTSVACTGGIAGEIYRDTMQNCNVKAIINTSVSSSSIYHAVGGVVGSTQTAADAPTLIEGCWFVGAAYDKTGYAHLGGVAGSTTNKTTVRGCAGLGLMSSVVTSSSIGTLATIVGNNIGTVENCYGTNSLQGSTETNRIGGIVGWASKLTTPTSVVRNNVFTGQVYLKGVIKPDQALLGKSDDGSVIENNYIDAQMSANNIDDHYLSTSELISGKTLTGLDPNLWNFKAGRYPSLKVLPDDVAELASIPLILNETDKANNVKKDFTAPNSNIVTWKLLDDNSKYVDETSSLKIENDKIKLKGSLSFEYVVARTENESGSFTRMHFLSIAPSQFEGNGTAENPYRVKTVNDLKNINEGITVYRQTYEGDFFRLENNIDLTGVTDFWGMGDDSDEMHIFNGNFDGNGFTIDNWKASGIVTTADGTLDTKLSRPTIALFGMLGPKGVIKNITLGKGCKIEGYSGIAGIVAMNAGLVSNCQNFGTVTCAQYYAGGIAARVKETGKVTDCYNAGTIISGRSYAAGIAAEIKEGAIVEYCQNDGDIKTDQVTLSYYLKDTSIAAGIVGITTKNSYVNYCVNNGNISTPTTAAGIIGGYASGAFVKGCLNTGIVMATNVKDNIGAIIGEGRGTTGIEDCWYDSQIFRYGGNDLLDSEGINPASTATLVSGTQLGGLDKENFDYQKGAYPVLKKFTASDATNAYRRMYVTFADGENSGEMSSAAILSVPTGITWSLNDESASLAVENNKIVIKNLQKPIRASIDSKLNGFTRNFAFTAINIPFDGEGTKENPYKIKSVADMSVLSEYTSDFGVRYNGKFFEMTADIDFSSVDNFKPVAFSGSNSFNGSFDGRNHSLKNINISWTDKTSTIGYQYVGVFGNVGEGGSISNLVAESGTVSGYSYTAALAGTLRGTMKNCINKGVKIENTSSTNAAGLVAYLYGPGQIVDCVNKASMNMESSHIGGIVSYAGVDARIIRCHNEGNLTSTKNYLGGIAGVCTASIFDCYNTGTITGVSYGGGLVGSMTSTDSMVNCYNKGKLIFTGSTIGGVCGEFSAKGEHIYNYSSLSATNGLGGLFGNMKANSELKNSANYGDVTATKANCGGIAASMTTVKVDSCRNYGNLTSVYSYVGGIGGNISGAESRITNCINYGNIIGTTVNSYCLGGISGQCAGYVTDCVNFGNVSGESYSTGGIGGQGTGKVSNCINFGTVSTNYDVATKANGNAGGIWGHASNIISDCINFGDVQAKRYAGGILGYCTTNVTKLKRNYVSARILCEDPNTQGAIVYKIDATKPGVDSCYYNTDIITEFPMNELSAASAIGKTALELRNASLGDAYDYHRAALPTLKVFTELPEGNFYAAMIVFAEEEHAGNFKTKVDYEPLVGIEWTHSDNILKEEKLFRANAKNKGEDGFIQMKAGDLVKRFDLKLYNDNSDVDMISDGKLIERIIYFSTDGRILSHAEEGQIVIEKIIYTDGSSKVRKVIYSR